MLWHAACSPESMIAASRVTWKLAGLVAASAFMPAVGAATLPNDVPASITISWKTAAGPISSPPAPAQVIVADAARATDTSIIAAATGYLPDYNPSDLNGGNRGFALASLTVNQTLPAMKGG